MDLSTVLLTQSYALAMVLVALVIPVVIIIFCLKLVKKVGRGLFRRPAKR